MINADEYLKNCMYQSVSDIPDINLLFKNTIFTDSNGNPAVMISSLAKALTNQAFKTETSTQVKYNLTQEQSDLIEIGVRTRITKCDTNLNLYLSKEEFRACFSELTHDIDL